MSDIQAILVAWLVFNGALLVLFVLLFARRLLRWHPISRLTVLGSLGMSGLFGLFLLIVNR